MINREMVSNSSLNHTKVGFKATTKFIINQIVGLPFSALIFYEFPIPLKRNVFGLLKYIMTKPVELLEGEQSAKFRHVVGTVEVKVFSNEKGQKVGNIQLVPDKQGHLDVVIRGKRYVNTSSPVFRVDTSGKPLIVETIEESDNKRKKQNLTHGVFQYYPDDKLK